MYKKNLQIHFMGIGGIGVSGVAEIVRLRGYSVSGCDANTRAKKIEHLRSIGCIIDEGHHADHINNADVLVYSSAIDQKNPEVQAALKKGIPVIPRALMLAELMRTKYSVAVSGSHGKTTTTSLISHILLEADRDPTVVIGGMLKNIASNAKLGNGELLIAEADESDRSFLYLNPAMAVVTNIDAEHLDTYKDLNDVKDTFKNFLERLPFYGSAVLCIDDPHVQSILPLPHINVIKYGLSTRADIFGQIIELLPSKTIFDVYDGKASNEPKKLGRITLNMPGQHNVQNSLAAIALCLELDISFEKIASALEGFRGIERRFEFKGTYKGAEIFDDYGHHPTEIKHTLMSAVRRKKGNLHVVFQPHRYSRTEALWDDFVELFSQNSDIATLMIVDIHPASEAPRPNITSQRFVEAIKLKNPDLNVVYQSSFQAATQSAQCVMQNNDLLLTLGAGKVYTVGEKLLSL